MATHGRRKVSSDNPAAHVYLKITVNCREKHWKYTIKLLKLSLITEIFHYMNYHILCARHTYWL